MEMDMGGPGYDIGILAHVIGILLLAGALMVQVAGTLLLRQVKTIDQVKLVAGLLRRTPILFGAAGGLILISGIFLSYLHISEGGAFGWLIVAIIVFLGMAAYGSLNGRRFDKQLGAAIAQSGDKVTPELTQYARDPHQLSHAIVSGCMFLDIVYLMIYQPNLLVSIAVTIGIIGISWVMSYPTPDKEK